MEMTRGVPGQTSGHVTAAPRIVEINNHEQTNQQYIRMAILGLASDRQFFHPIVQVTATDKACRLHLLPGDGALARFRALWALRDYLGTEGGQNFGSHP
jgi:hypothetical protein